ncbi:MAG TPA: YecA family protein [Cellvibrio sp.]|nr:YecA family protein [Cellvibrio sp.]
MSASEDLKTKAALSPPEIREILEGFLSSPGRPPHTMNFSQLDGYVRAMALGPEPLDIKDWVSLVFVDQNPNFDDKDHELFITRALNSLYNMHKVQFLNNQCYLPCPNEYTEEPDGRSDIEQWARGFMQGFIVCQSRWNFFLEESQTVEQLPAIIKNTIYDEIDAMMSVISSVADAEYALSQGVSTEELKQIFSQLPRQIVSYGKAGQLLRKYM